MRLVPTLLLLVAAKCERRDAYEDQDGDGYDERTDCNDADALVHPESDERCNGGDDDCDGVVDEDAVDALSWYLDADGDGRGDPLSLTVSCSPPTGFVDDRSDCDDSCDVCWDGADEVCDGQDNNCNGLDENEEAIDTEIFYVDADGDGYGNPAVPTEACELPVGMSEDATDCDDALGTTWPGAPDDCGDGVDDDCDGDLFDCQESLGLSFALWGEAEADGAGNAVSGGADVDGDGLADLVVGAPWADASGSSSGAVYLVHGPITASASLADVGLRLDGAAHMDQAGIAVAMVGDTDGDGVHEVLVGAATESTIASGAGVAYLLSWPEEAEESHELATLSLSLYGEAEQDYAGGAVACAGDVDGDGLMDVLVGAGRHDASDLMPDAGAAYLFLGPVTASLSVADADSIYEGAAAYDNAGSSLAGLGDTDGDGLDDFVIGMHKADGEATDGGAVSVVTRPLPGVQGLADVGTWLSGEAEGDLAGFAVASAGDMNGDGRADMVVGAYLHDADIHADAGAAYLVFGPISSAGTLATRADVILMGTTPAGYAGYAVAGVGDLDGSGSDDLLVGAWHEADLGLGAGMATLVLEWDHGEQALQDAGPSLTGEVLGDRAAAALSPAGDVDGDGLDDALIGARGESTAGEQAGAVYLRLGGERW